MARMRLQSPADAGPTPTLVGPGPSEASYAAAPLPTTAGQPTPTPEQHQIIDAFRTGAPVVVEALAGTGKTTTLRMLAALNPSRPGVYLAYNKAIVDEARGRFPARVTVGTAHSLAYQAIGRQYAHRLPGRGRGSSRLPAREIARLLRVRAGDAGGRTMNPVLITRLAEATVNRYCQSGDGHIQARHLPPRVDHLGERDDIAQVVIPVANRMWLDLCSLDGRLYYTHDVYLKQWQTGNPRIPTDYVLFDEAQDANPAIAAVVRQQTHAQLVYVGDRNQQLYAWRGAVDAMNDIEGTRLPLTRSFRFGPAVAEAANEWLELLESPWRVVGHDPIPSRVGALSAAPDAILCRTNGAALGHILRYQAQGVPVAMAPGDRTAGADIRSFAFAARNLMAGKGTDHPELAAFTMWRELLDYVEEEEGGADLKRMVNIVNRLGPSAVIDAIERLVPKERARITVSTAHKAKGLEWDHVQVADDFNPPEDERPERADLMLAYVTVTRAKLELDPGSLDPWAWQEAMSR